MKIIKCMVQDIECELDMAEDYAKKAIQYKVDYPDVAQGYISASSLHLDLMRNMHEKVVNLITAYRKEKGEPPAPMMAIYEYMHERFINKATAVRALHEMYKG